MDNRTDQLDIAGEVMAEDEHHSRRRLFIAAVGVLIAMVVGVSAISYWQGWLGMDRLPGAGTSGDSSRLDGFEPEIDNAVALINTGDSQAAKEILESIIDEAPNHVLANFNLGVIAHFDGQLEEAVRRYTKSLVGAPLFSSALYNRGLANRDLGEIDQAIADLNTVVANYPDSASAAYNLGKILIEQGDTSKGNALITRAKRLDPSLGS